MLYPDLEAYWMTELDRHGEELALKGLPPGFRLLYLIWRWASDINNGGFGQFFGNAKKRDETGKVTGKLIVETFEALERMDMDEFLRMTLVAMELRADKLPPDVLVTGRKLAAKLGSASTTPINLPRTRSEIEGELFDLSQRFYETENSWIKPFDRYVKAHPDEFVHSSGQLSP